jgi:hypothetical protein
MRSQHLRRGLAAVVVLAIVGIAVAVSGPSAAAAKNSNVYVVHAIPNRDFDVYVNGKLTLSKFKPTSVAGPLSLPPGTYDVALVKPGDPLSKAVLDDKALTVPSGKNVSVVAHLNLSGKLALTAFVNNTSTIAAGKTRFVVRHVADAPAVDVRIGKKAVFTNLTDPQEASTEINAGAISAEVVLAGTKTVVLGPTKLHLAAGSETIIYVIGDTASKDLALVAQTMTGLGHKPAGIPAGSGGLAATGVNPSWYALLALGLLLVGFGAISGWRMQVARRADVSAR